MYGKNDKDDTADDGYKIFPRGRIDLRFPHTGRFHAVAAYLLVLRRKVMELAEKFLSYEGGGDALFYVWCHGYELDFNDSYGKLNELASLMTGQDDVICVNNTEFYKACMDGRISRNGERS